MLSTQQGARWLLERFVASPENGPRGSEKVGAWVQVTQLVAGQGAGLKESSWGPPQPPCLSRLLAGEAPTVGAQRGQGLPRALTWALIETLMEIGGHDRW